MDVLDYLFYRVYKFYGKKRNELPVLRGCIVLMLLVFSTLLTISSIIEIFFKTPELIVEKYIMVVIMLLMLYLLWRRYGNREYVVEIEERYKEEELNMKRIRGWLFMMYLILMMLIPISVGFLRHNLGIDI